MFLLNTGVVKAAFCCKDPDTGQDKCFSDGQCCDGTYDPFTCFKFEMWVEPKNAILTVGKRTNVNLYIHSLCPYPDNYNLTYNITSPNPALIQVDLNGFDYIKDVGRREIRVVYPSITILASGVTGTKIFFNATSEGNNTVQRNATLTLISSDLPLSLPEFDSLALLVIVFLVGIIYFVIRAKFNKC